MNNVIKFPNKTTRLSGRKPRHSCVDDETSIDLHTYINRSDEFTLYVRVEGDSTESYNGISQGDLLIVDRNAKPQPNDIIIKKIGEEYAVELFRQNRLQLVTPNTKKKSLGVTEGVEIIGVVTFCLTRMVNRRTV